jgi:DNA repair exonuclease SbcCD ATPase subunit
LVSELQTARQERQEADSGRRQLESQQELLQRQLASLQAEAHGLAATLDESRTALQLSREQSQQLQAELQHAQQLAADSQQQLAATRSERDSLRAQAQQAPAIADSVGQPNPFDQTALAAAQEEVQRLRTELAAARQPPPEAAGPEQHLLCELESAHLLADAAAAEIQSLRQEQTALQDRIAEMADADAARAQQHADALHEKEQERQELQFELFRADWAFMLERTEAAAEENQRLREQLESLQAGPEPPPPTVVDPAQQLVDADHDPQFASFDHEPHRPLDSASSAGPTEFDGPRSSRWLRRIAMLAVVGGVTSMLAWLAHLMLRTTA